MKYSKSVEQWCILEIELNSQQSFARPFSDVKLQATFHKDGATQLVTGFYDGGSVWRIRFMPDTTGEYTFCTVSNQAEFHGLTGSFHCTPATKGNHGPVKVKGHHFVYADTTPCFVMGTTAYAWTYRPAKVREQTLQSFCDYGFNKIRMLVFPKYYTSGDVDVAYDPPCHPFAGEPNAFDFQSPNPAYFQNFEQRVADLMRLGIEADVILFHPYDRWGIDRNMEQDDDLLYIQYLVARLAAYRNVWWSLANEYDISRTTDGRFCVATDRKDWDLVGAFIRANDPHDHLISCHNIPFGIIYPDREWLSHVSYQHPDTYTLLLELQRTYNKPIVNDEYQYEGNVNSEWGNSDAATTVLRHWLAVMAGGYASHGEVYEVDGNNKDLFWSYGGTFVGESVSRLKFLRQIVESCPYQEMQRDYVNTDGQHYFSLSRGLDEYLIFCRYDMPGKTLWYGPWDGTEVTYEATIYDVWNCVQKETKIVKKSQDIPITAWTVIHLKRL